MGIPVTRPFTWYRKVWARDLDIEVWPTFEKLWFSDGCHSASVVVFWLSYNIDRSGSLLHFRSCSSNYTTTCSIKLRTINESPWSNLDLMSLPRSPSGHFRSCLVSPPSSIMLRKSSSWMSISYRTNETSVKLEAISILKGMLHNLIT